MEHTLPYLANCSILFTDRPLLERPAAAAALQRAGYTGRVGLEYTPATTTEAGLGWLPRERRGASAHTT